MSCQIVREDGKLTNVLAENGMPSQLYRSLRDFLTEEESLTIWTATQTPQFKEWFKGSQFVDSNGEPMLFFHGSREQFEEFKADERRYSTHALDRKTFFFTDKRKIAMQYGNVLYPIFLNAQSIEKHSYNGSVSVREFRDMESKFINSADTDAVILDTLDKGGRQKQYVVFDTTQIKSVFDLVDDVKQNELMNELKKSRIVRIIRETGKSPIDAMFHMMKGRHILNMNRFTLKSGEKVHTVRHIDLNSTDGSRAGYQERMSAAQKIVDLLNEKFEIPFLTLVKKTNFAYIDVDTSSLGYSKFNDDMKKVADLPFKKKQIDSAANDAALDKKMKDVMSLMGIKMADYEDYRQWYEKKYGKPLNAIGVADMLHKVIAVKEGHTDISTLPEEVGHFIIWALRDDAVMKEMIANAHLSEEWTLHSEEYLADYNGDEQMVRMEIIGKMLADQIVNDHRSGIVKPYWRQKLEQLWRKFLNMFGVKPSEKDLLKSKISEISSDVLRGDVAKYGNRLQKGKQLSDVKIFKKLDPKITINSKVFDSQIDTIDKAVRLHEDRIRYYRSRNMEGFVKAEEEKIALLKTQKKAKRHTYAISKIIKEAFDHTERIQQRIDSLKKQKEDGTITDDLIQNARILDEIHDHSLSYKDLIINILNDLENVDTEGMTEADKAILEDALSDARYVNRTIDNMSSVYKKYSKYLVAEWIKPVFNNIRYNSEADRQVAMNSLEKHLEEGIDISNIDASVRSMATSRSSGDILSLIDARIKDYIEIARLQTEEDKHDILEIHENYGLNDTSFMYEMHNGVPTGYIISEVHHGAFEAERSKFMADLRRSYTTEGDTRKWSEVYEELSDDQKKKYDTAVAKWFSANTEVRSDAEKIKEDMRQRIYNTFVTEKYNDDVKKSQEDNAAREYNNWLSRMKTFEYENGELVSQGFKGILVRPILSKYSNPAFARLTADQKKYYADMMEKREQLFIGLNIYQRFSMIAPQVRKDWLERLKAGGNYKENLIEFTKELYMPTEDDTEFIKLDEGGKRVQAPPLHFFDKIDNKLNLSTDFTGGMVMLADTTNRHKTLSAATSMIRMVQDVVDNRTILSGRKDDQRDEILGRGGNTAKRLRNFIEMNVYGEQKEREIYAKAVDTFMTYVALNTLALNVFAGVNNSILGNLMIKQEQVSQKYVNKENMKFADKAMSKKALSEVMNDVGKLTTTSKLRLFLDKVDALQDHKSKMYTNADRNRRSRMFNMSTLFFMTTFGEWQIGARMALAMADTVKLKDKDGNSINMYDAFEVKGKRLIIKEGITNQDGSAFTEDNIIPFNMRLAQINQSMHGIYNDIDKSALQRHAIGRLIFQFRKYFVPQFDRRWATKHLNAALGEEEEGYYRTAARVWKKLHEETNAMKFILMMKSPMNADGLRAKGLTDLEIANTIKTATEIYFILGFMVIGTALSMLAEGIDDDDEPILSWNVNMAAYQLQRLSTEMGAYILPNELLKLMSSPAASVNQLSHITKFFSSFNVNPFDDEEFIRHYKSGRNKDDARIYVWTKKAVPLVDTIEDWFYPEEKRGYFNK